MITDTNRYRWLEASIYARQRIRELASMEKDEGHGDRTTLWLSLSVSNPLSRFKKIFLMIAMDTKTVTVCIAG